MVGFVEDGALQQLVDLLKTHHHFSVCIPSPRPSQRAQPGVGPLSSTHFFVMYVRRCTGSRAAVAGIGSSGVPNVRLVTRPMRPWPRKRFSIASCALKLEWRQLCSKPTRAGSASTQTATGQGVKHVSASRVVIQAVSQCICATSACAWSLLRATPAAQSLITLEGFNVLSLLMY
jgi:hypothetical protein